MRLGGKVVIAATITVFTGRRIIRMVNTPPHSRCDE
jgi:hypothetical protein